MFPHLNNSSANNQLREQVINQPSSPEAMYEIGERLVAMDADERYALYQQHRQKMLSDKIDCAKFLTYFIENYPKSVEEIKDATAEFWKQFK